MSNNHDESNKYYLDRCCNTIDQDNYNSFDRRNNDREDLLRNNFRKKRPESGEKVVLYLWRGRMLIHKTFYKGMSSSMNSISRPLSV